MPGKSFWLEAWWPVLVIAALGFVIFLLGLILLLRARTRPPGARRSMVPAAFGLLSLAGLVIALTGAILLFQFGSYRRLSEWEVMARIKCSARGRVGEYDLEFVSLAGGKVRNSRRYAVFGDRWALRADVIEWAGLPRALGLHRSLKITELESVYDRERDYLERPVTRLGTGSDRFALSLAEGRLPSWPYRWFVRSVYRISVSHEPVPEELFDVIGTKDGLAVRPAAF